MSGDKIQIMMAEFLKHHPGASLSKSWSASKKMWIAEFSAPFGAKIIKFYGTSGRSSHLAEYEAYSKAKQYFGRE